MIYSARRLTVATQQTFFYKLSNQDIFLFVHKIQNDVFNNSLLRYLPVGLCKEA